ncbi:hypothetical protein C1646_749698 [Rhizophagus diaphanus]|nr:hypothetical protein C1646_749698 [Rhizophagus diaphanus] [Rhizophagus sp. MUCL 43196]
MRRQGQNILLFIDNISTHTLYETKHLINITIEYLSPNTTHLQPCDQGLLIVLSTIENCWLKADILPKDDENEIDIGADSIVHFSCPKHFRLSHTMSQAVPHYVPVVPSISRTCPSTTLDADTQIYFMYMKELEKVQALINELNFKNQINAEEFIHCDDSEITTEMYSNEKILKAVLPNNQEKEIGESLDLLPSVTHNEVIESYEKVILYLKQQKDYFDMNKKELKYVKKLKKEALKQHFLSARQTNLNSFINSK